MKISPIGQHGLCRSVVWILLAVLLASPAWCDSLGSLKLQYATRLELAEQPIESLTEKYRKALETLEKKRSEAGNLKAVLEVKKELEGLASGESAAKVDGELGRMRNIYTRQLEKLKSESNRKVSKLRDVYLKQLVSLQSELTKQQKISEALEVRNELEKERKTSNEAKIAERGKFDKDEGLQWLNLNGARFTESKEMLELAGPLKLVPSMVVLKKKLPDECNVTGRCQVSGSWAGFVLSSDKEGSDFHALFSKADGTGVRLEHIKERKRTPKFERELPWEKNRWLKFSLEKDKKRWEFTLDGEAVEMSLTDGTPGDYFGLVIFDGSTITIKDLKIVPQE
jgi:hypothetical protein